MEENDIPSSDWYPVLHVKCTSVYFGTLLPGCRSQFPLSGHCTVNFLSDEFGGSVQDWIGLLPLKRITIHKINSSQIIVERKKANLRLIRDGVGLAGGLLVKIEVSFTRQHEKIVPPGQDFRSDSIMPYCWHPRTAHESSWQLVSQHSAWVFSNLHTATRSQFTNKYFIWSTIRITGEERMADVNWHDTQEKN